MGQAASSAKRDKPPKAFHESDSGGSSEDSGSRARAGNGLERDPESVPDGSTQSQAPHIDTDGHQKTGGEPDRRGNSWKCVSKECTIALTVALAATFSASIASIIALLAVQRAKPALADGCPPAGSLCPDGWVGYRGKCYSFSEGEGSWTDSRSNCSALSASLAGIDTLRELAFMLRYKGKPDHWIGLRKDSGQLWKWANGTEFNYLLVFAPLSVSSLVCEVPSSGRAPSQGCGNSQRALGACVLGVFVMGASQCLPGTYSFSQGGAGPELPALRVSCPPLFLPH